jgi:DNA-binding NarL/FixJ family response regulator
MKESPSTKARRSRVMLVDDHPIIRKGLADSINQEPDLVVCCEAETAASAMKLASANKPDLAIVDLSLPDNHGLELIKNLKALFPKLRILVLSMHEEAVYAPRALRAGAMGYVMKSEPPAQVMKAIAKINRSETWFSPSVTNNLLARIAGNDAKAMISPEDRLSDRELEIFELIGKGLSSQAIARQLHISPKTVLAHRENIKTKLGIPFSRELAHRAFSWNLEH